MRNHCLSRKLVTLVACVAMALPGCSTQIQRIGADNGSDVCRPQRVTLDSTGNFFAEDIIQGAAIGAAFGGLSGLLAGRDVRGALIGAATGGALGAAGGYWGARQQQASDQASLYRTISSDIQRENGAIDKTQTAFNQLVDCRRSEASQVRADLGAGRITRDQAQAAMAAVRERSAGDLRIAQIISAKVQERSNDFAFANNQVNSSTSADSEGPSYAVARSARRTHGSIPQPATPAGQVQVATSTNLAKREQLSQSIARVQANPSAFELS